MRSIFVITVMSPPRPHRVVRRDGEVAVDPLRRDRRSWGWYADRDRARDALARNLTDLHETTYDDAVIEEVAEGVCPGILSEEWFRFDPESGGYVPSPRPEDLSGVKGFSLG